MAGGVTAERGTGAATLAEMATALSERFDGAALKYKEGDDWTELSYEELGKAAREVAAGLIDLGIEKGDRVAIFSETRMEWTLADLGAILAGAVVVPIYQTSSAEEAEHVLKDSESKLVFVEDSEKLDTAREAAEKLEIEHYVVFEGDAGDGAITLDELRERGGDHAQEVDERAKAVEPGDTFTLVYTSGTTGKPKGCVLTHENFRADLEMMEDAVEFGDEVVLFIFLPLAHVLSRMAQMLTLDVGGTLAFWGRDKDKAMEEMKEVEPTHFPAVPRIFEKIYEEARKTADGALKEKIFEKAVDVGRQVRELERKGEEPGFLLQKEYDLADRQVLSKVRELFGSRLEFALTGAAPVDKEMLEFFDACGVLILEGYGATETSAVTVANRPDDFRFGTVGKPLPGTELKIAPPEKDEDDEDDEDLEEGVGEILVKGPHVFQGYHGLKDKTDEVFDGEWFKTGDLGKQDDDGFVTISGRAKEIIVTSSGKNITPTNIEEKIAKSDRVEQAVVIGDDRKYLVALIDTGDDADPDDESLREEIQKAIDDANSDLAKIEQVKKFAILPRALSQEEGELTPTMKLKREKIEENFSDEIDALYDDDSDSGSDD
jgi:long-chain acyl-CoA synthetase